MTEFNLKEYWPYKLSVLSESFSQLISQAYSTKYQLNVSQWRILVVIYLRRKITATEVSGYTKLDKMTVSRAVKYLQNRKLITTKNSPSDRRSRILSVTTTGQQICQDILPALLSYQDEVFSVLDDSEKISFEAIYEKLMQKIGEIS